MRRQRSRTAWILLVLLAPGPSGCAGPSTMDEDPYESFNRRVFAFNEVVDEYVYAPVAWAWDGVFPRPIQAAFVRAWANMMTPLQAVQHALAGQLGQAGTELGRFVVNSTLGVAGLFDPAQAWWEWEADPTDFGATLASWGMPPGPYLVLPFLGPETARSTLGLAAEIPLTIELVHAYGLRVTPVQTAERINARAWYAEDLGIAREEALDYYVYVRSITLQRQGARRPDDLDDFADPMEDTDD